MWKAAPHRWVSWPGTMGPNSATPWAESIRQLIVGEQMPPWYVDSLGPAVKGGSRLSPVQSDKLLTWATGGTPEGDPERKPTPSTYQARWTGGPPDLLLPMESELHHGGRARTRRRGSLSYRRVSASNVG